MQAKLLPITDSRHWYYLDHWRKFLRDENFPHMLRYRAQCTTVQPTNEIFLCQRYSSSSQTMRYVSQFHGWFFLINVYAVSLNIYYFSISFSVVFLLFIYCLLELSNVLYLNKIYTILTPTKYSTVFMFKTFLYTHYQAQYGIWKIRQFFNVPKNHKKHNFVPVSQIFQTDLTVNVHF